MFRERFSKLENLVGYIGFIGFIPWVYEIWQTKNIMYLICTLKKVLVGFFERKGCSTLN